MSAPVKDVTTLPKESQISVILDAGSSAFYSLFLLNSFVDDLSGLHPWQTKTLAAMSKTDRDNHDLVVIGFYYAVLPEHSFERFEDYLAHLEETDATALRDKILNTYLDLPCKNDKGEIIDSKYQTPEDFMVDVETYLDFLVERIHEDQYDAELERKAYYYLTKPQEMKELIVSHLHMMWDIYLYEEWERVTPILEEAVKAFKNTDFSSMTKKEAVEYVSGLQVENEHWKRPLDNHDRILFIPNPHVGPYLGKLWAGNTLSVIFNPRSPEESVDSSSNLNRNDIFVQLNILADDTRLAILKLIGENGEMRSQEVMDTLDLSQSAASRHLNQLNAIGFLNARRMNGAKSYSLNEERIHGTLASTATFVTGKKRS